MIGIGPFITIPGFIAAMHGPQALIAWVIAALLVLCDGLVWSELGAALPASGGSYTFLSTIYGGYRWGRIVPFLFIWQFLVSGTLEMASGYIGAMDYLKYALPELDQTLTAWHVPGGRSTLAALAVVVVTLSLCRHIRSLGWLSVVLCAGTLVTVLTVIGAGLWKFDSSLLAMPEGAFRLDRPFFHGLGGAMAIAIYDYLGYYNICHLGDEVVDPGRTIPRAVMISVVVVAGVYLTMNTAILGVIPWEQAMHSKHVASEFMEQIFGRGVAVAFTGLILWTVAACLFAITLGYSRIPFAAARNGDFFPIFAKLHVEHRYPIVSLWALGLLTAIFCYYPLQKVIDAAVTVRIVVQFIGQIVGLHLLRTTRPDVRLPFRMWLYPLPSLVALIGWTFVLATAHAEILYISLGVLVSGVAAYGMWRAVEALQFASQGERVAAFDELISGRARGVVPFLLRLALRIASWFYGVAVLLRDRAYHDGLIAQQRATLPIVSIGNVTTGGTGKTPFAAWVAKWFRAHGVRVCILSRGYGAAAGGLNDEALVLEQLCPDVPHLQHADRATSARIAHEELDSQLLLLDDGFQHRRLARDLEIVLIDALNPWGYGRLLPRGLLREPLTALRRAHVIVITRVDQCAEEELATIRTRLARLHPAAEVVEVAFPVETLINASGERADIRSMRGETVAAFCGIGNPQAFRRSMSERGIQIAAFRPFPDHHGYSRDDVAELQNWARSQNVGALLTTQKDLVKLGVDSLGGRPLWAVQIGAVVVCGAERLEAHLREILEQAPRDHPQ